ncbi:MAG: STAS domain-containing protein [Cyclobacteriaceae bacterium]
MVNIEIEKKEDIHFIRVTGDIDAGSSIHLDNAFKEGLETGESKIAVDLEGLVYISSAGLGVFVSYLDEFELKKIKLVLFGIQEAVRQVFDILGLEKLIDIAENEEGAIAKLNE